MEIKNKILELISLKKEGLTWDFKLKHHENNVKMLGDVLSLSNVIANESRYLIFGIDPKSYEIKGLDTIKLQADVLDYILKLKWANSVSPTLVVHNLEINGNQVDVFEILDCANKPYYIEKDESNNGNYIRAGIIKSRVIDRNTPSDSIANWHDIKRMWIEQLGINLKPRDRFVKILLETDNWGTDGQYTWHYEPDPKYSIEISQEDRLYNGNPWWCRKFIEKPNAADYTFKYAGQKLFVVNVINYYSENLTFPMPEIRYFSIDDKFDNVDNVYDLFFYKRDTINYSLLHYIRHSEKKNGKIQLPLCTQIKPPMINIPLIILNNEVEEIQLINEIKNKWNERPWKVDKDNNDIDSRNSKFSDWVLNLSILNNA